MYYQDFELEISPNDADGSYIASVRSPIFGEASESFFLPAAATLNNLIGKMRGFSRSSRAANSPELQAACRLGELLFQQVFTGEVGNLFKSGLDQTNNENGLRLKLILQNAAELSALPWEFLYHPKKRDFLAHSPSTPIVRYLQHATAIKPLEVQLPLALLVAIASPNDQYILDTAKERRELAQALADLEKDGTLRITWLENTTVERLADILEAQQFHLLHFIGHSDFDEKHGEGALILETAAGHSDYYEATRLKVLLHDHHSLRLVVLNSCDGAKQDVRDPFSSIATTLMLAGIPAVIAMQFAISDQAAISFAKIFYRSLAKGLPIDESVGRARKYLFAVEKNNVEWGTPVLYLRSKDGVLFRANAAVVSHPTFQETPVVAKQNYSAIEQAKLTLAEKQKQLAEEKARLALQEELRQIEEETRCVELEQLELQRIEENKKVPVNEANVNENIEQQQLCDAKEFNAKGNDFYNKQEYIEALYWYKKSAELGNADGQVMLAFMYHNGNGIKQDYTEAVKWYYKAAMQNHAVGQNNLATMYQHGLGISKNYAEAVKWYQKSVAQGNVYAQSNLALMYENGYGVTKDKQKALELYRLAAAQNETYQVNVERVESQIKKIKVFKWLLIIIIACIFLISLGKEKQSSVETNVTATVIPDNKQKPTENLVTSDASSEISNEEQRKQNGIEFNAKGNEFYNKKDYVEAVKWYQKAAEQGNADGQNNLGFMYLNGFGVKQDYAEAVKWYQKAAEQGNAYGPVHLGYMYQNGYGVKQDYAEAVKWYQKAAEQGNADGQNNLGWMYEKGLGGLTQDKQKALELYRQAAAQNKHEQHKINFEILQKEISGK